MALRYAVQNGNWSNTATWDGGTLPGNGDDVYTDGKIVTIDIDLVGQYRPARLYARSRGSGGTTGGYFVVNTTRQIGEPDYPVYVYGPDVNNYYQGCINFSAASATLTVYGEIIRGPGSANVIWNVSSGTVTVTGNISGASGGFDAVGIRNASSGTVTVTGDVTGGSGSYTYGILNESTGTITVTGNTTGGSGSYADGIRNFGTGAVAVTGNVAGGSGSTAYGIYNHSSGTVTVTGNVTGGSGTNTHGIHNASLGTVTVTGNVTGGSGGSAYGISNASSGTVTINGDVRPTATGQVANAVYNNHSIGYITINGDVYGGRGAAAVYANNGRIRINGDLRWDETYSNAPAVGTSLSGFIVLNGKIRHHYGTTGFFGHTLCTGRVLLYNGKTSLTEYAESATGGEQVTGNPIYHYGESLLNFNHPSEPDVRFGVTYGPDNQYTGSCRVPPPQSVAYGVPVDDTTGTAFIDISEIIAGTGVTVSDSNNAAATFKTNLSGSKTKFVGMFLRFKTGSLSGEIREIVDFDETTKFVTVNKSFSAIPSSGDSFTLIGYSGR